MARFLKATAAALVGAVVLAIALAATYAYGYRQGVDDMVKVVDGMADKWMRQGNPKYTTPRAGITVEEVPQK